jgi:hypothetical protein
MNEIEMKSDEQLLLPFEPPLEEKPPQVGGEAADLETLRAENEALRQALRTREARDQITASLRAAGARSPELMFAAAKESLQFGEDGAVQNAEAVVGELKRKFPEQFGGVFPHPSIDGGAGASVSANVLTKESLARMKPAEIARLDWESVKQILAS